MKESESLLGAIIILLTVLAPITAFTHMTASAVSPNVNTVSIATVIKNSSGQPVTSVVMGNPVHDTATLSGATGSAGGSVNYNLFSNGGCSSPPLRTSTSPVTNGVVTDSGNMGTDTLSPGSYSFNAVYSGDPNNSGAASPCEPFTVRTQSSTSTIVFDASTNIAWSGTEVTGASAYDTATVTGVSGMTPTGTVLYTFFTNGACSGTGSSAGNVALTSNGMVLNSNTEGPLGAGSYSFNATYSGDSKYVGSSSSCEPITIGKATPTIVSTPIVQGCFCESPTPIGSQIYDLVRLTGVPGFPIGGSFADIVDYTLYSDAACTTVVFAGANDVGPSGLSASNIFTPTTPGTYEWTARFRGDANYTSVGTNCGDEPQQVVKGSPATGTTVYDASTNAVWTNTETTGASAYDTSSVTGSPVTPTGTVTYEFHTNGGCTGTGTFQTVTLSGGMVPNSASTGPLGAGTYSFNATYSGDSNYNGSTGSCEPFIVFDFTIVAGATPSQVLVGALGSSTITISAVNGSTGTVNLSVTTPAGITCSLQTSVALPPSPATPTLSCSATTAGDYIVTVTGTSGSLSHTTGNILFHEVDFTVSASPTSVTILAGATGTSTITVNGLNGFTGTVALSLLISPATGLSCSLSSASVSLSSTTTSVTSTLSCSGSAGIYSVTVTGQSGTLSHSAPIVTYTVQDFTITAVLPVSTLNSAVVLAVPADGTSTLVLTVTITSLDGFAGTVMLGDSLPSGLTCSAISPATLSGSGTATVSCTSTVAGKYPVTITGTSGPLSHSAAVTFTFVDYSISSSMSTLSNIPSVGYYGFTQITVTSLGYSGPVSLTSDPSINGPVVFALLKPTSTSLSSGGSASSTLDVWAGGPYASLTQQVHVYATTPEGTIQLVLTVSFSMPGNTSASYVTPDSFGGGGGTNQS